MSVDHLSSAEQLASQRNVLAFHRTYLAADRTLMASLRTALSLIGFGFTIFAFFRTLAGEELLGPAIPEGAPARFGLSLVILGVVLLVLGIYSDIRFSKLLAQQREDMVRKGLMASEAQFPRSLTLPAAFLLLLIGLVAIFSMMMRAAPFQ